MAPKPVPATDDSGPKNAEPPSDSSPAYSVFTRWERRMMVLLVGFAMLFSPLTANIYFPAMSKLEADLGTSAQLINLTVMSYLVLQAVAPALFGDLADAVGRRPAFLSMFALYSVANLGLALQHSFPALLTLRMMQSLGASATVAVPYGLVADIVTAAERGGVIGASMVATNLGPIASIAVLFRAKYPQFDDTTIGA
ncbi:major facilitator superfamily transporter [Staphylotrichum tortipilum]|uniref:Major facilitator superfamily transporter n=1 Tax=Staphylotrichum tortipilum TaxID=2831512 RepID=A0AAN6RWI6_9PEZI|nr:major facilitator superfamily transporter [Staphylotrichum longicolle]